MLTEAESNLLNSGKLCGLDDYLAETVPGMAVAKPLREGLTRNKAIYWIEDRVFMLAELCQKQPHVFPIIDPYFKALVASDPNYADLYKMAKGRHQ